MRSVQLSMSTSMMRSKKSTNVNVSAVYMLAAGSRKKDTIKDTNGHLQCVLTKKKDRNRHFRPPTNMHSTIDIEK